MAGTMTFRRGFFRAWLLFSVIWVLVIGISSYQKIAKDIQNLTPPMWQSDPLAQGEPQETLAVVGAALVLADGADDVAAARKLAATYRAIKEAGPTVELTVLQQARMETLKIEAMRQLVSDGSSAVSGALLPPLVILALGSALAWVLAGFRRG